MLSSGSRQNLRQTEQCGSRRGAIFPHMTEWCQDLPLQVQILVCLGLTNSDGLTLLIPWYPAPPQRRVSTRQMVATLGVPWDISWVASDPALTWNLNLYQSGKHHSLLPGDSLKTYLMQLKYLPMLFQKLRLTGSQQAEAGGGGSQNALGLLLTYSQARCW